jgi:hypothetical protein
MNVSGVPPWDSEIFRRLKLSTEVPFQSKNEPSQEKFVLLDFRHPFGAW